MDDFEIKLEKDILFTLYRIRAYERNKAIDDFAKKLKQDVMTITFGLRICDIDRIADQLKKMESGNNGTME